MNTFTKQGLAASLGILALAAGLALAPSAAEPKKLAGTIRVDGSSTVFPITEAVAEEFSAVHPGVRVTVGISGTGGGFKKFCAGETDISDASRPIKQKEADAAVQNAIEYIEIPVAYDGLSVMVNPGNDWVDHLTVKELNAIWKPGSTVKTWSDIRPNWPKRKVNLYGAGHDSGTFDYFTETINGKAQACREDFTASEDDNVLVQGIAGDKDSLGFFGYAYYAENKGKLKIVPIDNGKGPITPTDETIMNGTYAPLSRPIFIYVRKSAAKRPEVDAFVRFYIQNAAKLVKEVGYTPLPRKVYELAAARYDKRVTGSAYLKDPAASKKPLEQVYGQ